MEKTISKKELLIHWWSNYSSDKYSVETFSDFLLLLDEQLDLLWNISILSYSLNTSSTPLIDAINSHCLNQYKDALDFLFNTNSPLIETSEELEQEFINDLFNSYLESNNTRIPLANMEISIDHNKLS